MVASLPPDIPIPTPQNVREETLMETSIEEVEADAAEVEDLPPTSPEEEEMEHNEEANGEEEEQPEQQTDNEGRMPGQLPTAEQSTVKDYQSIKRAAKERIAALIGQEVTVSTRSNGSMKWKVIETYEPPEENLIQDINVRQKYGLKNFSTSDYKKSEVLAKMFLDLTFIDWTEKIDLMNNAVADEKCKCRKFNAEEFLVALRIDNWGC